MRTARLGDIAELERKTIQPGDILDGTRYVGLEDIDPSGSTDAAVEVLAGEVKSNKFVFEPDHILFGKLRPNLGKVGDPNFRGICSTDIIPIRASSHVDRRFLYRYLRTRKVRSEATRLAVGANLPRLKPQALAEFKIPLPPIEEQRRIAAVLDAADELRTKRRQALAKLDTLTQAIFIDMFGDPRSRSDLTPIGELVTAPITRGIDQPGDDVAEGVPYIKTTNFRTKKLRRDDLAKSATEIAAGFPRSVVQEGDLVMCIRATVGPVMIIDGELSGVNLSRGTARIAPDRSHILPNYFLHAMSTAHVAHQIDLQLRGATFLQIPLKEVRLLKVPLPPLIEQAEFVRRVESTVDIEAQQTDSASDIDTLFASLQQRAFAGEL